MNYLDFGITKLDAPAPKHAAAMGSHLIDSTTKTFLMTALQNSHETRMKYYSIVFNFAVFIGFILVFGGALYYCYLAKRSPDEINYKMMKDQEYVLSKIRFYQEENKNRWMLRSNRHSKKSRIILLMLSKIALFLSLLK